jgi:hypothetical protein
LTATVLIVVVPQIADTTLDGNHLAHLGTEEKLATVINLASVVTPR